jgi:hypothetical protein
MASRDEVIDAGEAVLAKSGLVGRALAIALEQAMSAAEWQPIASAPADRRIKVLWPIGRIFPEGRVDIVVFSGRPSDYHPCPVAWCEIRAPGRLIGIKADGMISVCHPGVKVRVPPPIGAA